MFSTRCFGLFKKSKSVFQLRSPLCSSTALSNVFYYRSIPTHSTIERNSILLRKSWQYTHLIKYIHSSFTYENKQNTNQKQTTSPTVKSPATEVAGNDLPEEKLGLFARFKKMSKEYWYVLLPVHVLTSTVWFGGFYYLSMR